MLFRSTPAVSLDIGSATDAVHVPSGTTAQRPTGANGMFRYNSTDNQFEGYADGAWGAIAGSGSSGASAMETDNFTGDDSTTAFTLSSSVSDEDNLIVFIDGVYQNKADYVASGTTLTLDTAPLAGRKISVYHVRAAISGSNCILNSFTGDGSDTTFTLTQNPASENNTQIFIDGVYQRKDSYSVSGTTLTFDAAPANGTAIEVMMFTQTDINTLPASFVSGLTEVTATGSDHLMVYDATDGALKKALASDLIETVGSTPSFTSATISGDLTVDTSTLKVDSTNNRVGIGESSPQDPLHLTAGSSDEVTTFRVSTSGALTLSRNHSVSPSITTNMGSGIPKLQLNRNSVLETQINAYGDSWFAASGVGNVGIGVTGQIGGGWDAALNVSNNNNVAFFESSGSGGAAAIGILSNSYTGTTSQIIFYNGSGGVAGNITLANGSTATSVSYNTTSDYRLKENVADMTGAIDRVKQLQPKRFNWISDDTDTAVDGFLAHETQAIVAEAVTGKHNEVDDDDNPIYQGIDQSKLVPLLTGALKEAITKIEALETRIETLENA